ncbi:hypothetical protein EV1_008243 [Malus domestica]
MKPTVASAVVPRQVDGHSLGLSRPCRESNPSPLTRRRHVTVAVSPLDVHVSSSDKTSPCYPSASSHPSNYSYQKYQPSREMLPLTHLPHPPFSKRHVEHNI